MGAAMQQIGGGGRRRGRGRGRRHAPMSEINVTPFVDVMLVLLIIFMVSAPLLTTGVPIDLPAAGGANLEGDAEPLTVSIDGTGRVFLQDSEVPLDEITTKLRAIAANGADSVQGRIFVRAADGVGYGDVVKVMSAINTAGYSRIGLVTGQARPDEGAR